VARDRGNATIARVIVDSGDQLALTHPVPAAGLGSAVVSASLRRLAFLAPDTQGAVQAFLENTDGSAVFAATTLAGGWQATAVSLSG
jgi:hypothetical protein